MGLFYTPVQYVVPKQILNSVVENKFTTLISQQLMNIYYYKLKQCIHLLQFLL